MFQNAQTYNSYLTELAQAAYADESESIAKLLFPAVEVTTAIGEYKRRDIDNAFRVYDTKLVRGNTPKRIDINATPAYYNCQPHALEVGTWRFDQDQEGGDAERESNLQDLMSAQLVSREAEAMSIFRAGVPAMSGAGTWSSADANIIAELNAMILQIHDAIGRMPSHLIFGLGAWATAQSHPSLVNRVAGIATDVTIERVKSMIVYPGLDVRIASMPYQAAPRGKTGALSGVVGNEVIVMYTQDAPTRNDMSAAKDFTLQASGPEVLSYEDERHMETVDSLYWSTDRQVTCPAAAARLEIK